MITCMRPLMTPRNAVMPPGLKHVLLKVIGSSAAWRKGTHWDVSATEKIGGG